MITFWFGVLGGLLINILRLYETARLPRIDRSPVLADPIYIIFQFVVFPLIGGLMTYAYQSSGVKLTPILAINIGASAPMLIKALVVASPPPRNNKERIG